MSDDHIGVKVNGVLYVKLEDARKLREGWDKADERIAELEAALRVYECSGKCANCYGAVRDTKYCGQIARAALEGGKDE